MLLSIFLFGAPLLALPTASKAPTSTNMTIYQGTSNSGTNVDCGVAVSHFTYKAGVCYNILSQGIGVPLSNTSSTCTYTLYSGVTNCNATAASNVNVIHLPKGKGEQCVATGVEDGGRWYHGSGIWKC